MGYETMKKIVKNMGLIRCEPIGREFNLFMHVEFIEENYTVNEELLLKVGISLDQYPVILTIADLALEGRGITDDVIIESIIDLGLINADELNEYMTIIRRYDENEGKIEVEIEEMMDKLTEEFKDLKFDGGRR